MKVTRIAIAATAAIALAASMAACSGSGSDGAAKAAACTNKIVHASAPQVTMWAWSPDDKANVDLFNKTHSDVQICWTNVGAGTVEYGKFSTAIAAGKGAPDVVMLEADHLTSYEIQGALVDLTKYGINKDKQNFSAGAWTDVSSGAAVYAYPVDGGPMAMMYRTDIFAKYGITVPKTWDEFTAAAQKLKDAGGPLMADFPANQPAFVQALTAQKGAVPFDYTLTNKKSIGIHANDSATKDVLTYWQGLLSNKLVGGQNQFTTDYISSVVNGKYATYLSAGWAPGYMVGAGAGQGADKGQWAVAPLPQWSLDNPVQVNWGGSAYVVTTQSKQPKLAAEVAMGLYGSEQAVKNGVNIASQFPLNVPQQKADWYVNQKVPFFSGQQANKEVYIPAAAGYQGFSYSPFTPYYYAQFTEVLTDLISGKQTGAQAADSLQNILVSYAKSQGLTVTG
ncbi:MAG TPA: extracellular solute-binding protein [Microbacteriaceae bacterium]